MAQYTGLLMRPEGLREALVANVPADYLYVALVDTHSDGPRYEEIVKAVLLGRQEVLACDLRDMKEAAEDMRLTAADYRLLCVMPGHCPPAAYGWQTGYDQ